MFPDPEHSIVRDFVALDGSILQSLENLEGSLCLFDLHARADHDVIGSGGAGPVEEHGIVADQDFTDSACCADLAVDPACCGFSVEGPGVGHGFLADVRVSCLLYTSDAADE